MSKAKEVGERIGRAIARDVLADNMPREWAGLGIQDGDQLLAVGIEPESLEWEEAEKAARKAYLKALSVADGETATACYVITESGRVLAFIPRPDLSLGYVLTDETGHPKYGVAICEEWESIPDDDPRITAEIRAGLQPLIDDARG